MPWTLWRYTFVELWRVMLICTAVLVVVISFAAAVKPLAEGALSPIGAIRFMLLAVPPMLAYALPFSAGFGASLAYHRMAQDNETIAAHSGGVSHRAVLLPAIVSAALLAGSLGLLNEWVIPRFLQRMERMITLDVAQVMIRQIEKGQAAKMGDAMIHAEAIDEIPPPPGSAARQMFLLHRVAVVQLDEAGRVESDATVKKAWVVLAEDPSDPSRTVCAMQLEDGVAFLDDGGLREIEEARPPHVLIPDAFSDDPKYRTWRELRELKDDPDRIGPVTQRRVLLVGALAEREVSERFRTTLEYEGRITLVGEGGSRLEVTADDIRLARPGAWYLSREDGPVRVRRFEVDPDGGTTPYTDRAEEAWIRLEETETSDGSLWQGVEEEPGLRFTLQLVDVTIEGPGGVPTSREFRNIPRLRLQEDPYDRFAAMKTPALLDEVERLESAEAATPAIVATAERLDKRYNKLIREVISKQQERMAMAGSCFVMVLLGAVVAMRHKDSLPLVVYLWSFFPALAMVLLISAGQQHTHSEDVPVGLAILWSGVGIVGVLTLLEYRKLARH